MFDTWTNNRSVMMRRYLFSTLTLAVALSLGCTGNDAGVGTGEEAETGVVDNDAAIVDDAGAEQVEVDADDSTNDPPADPAVEEEPATELPETGSAPKQ
jgi:hypothetical protein